MERGALIDLLDDGVTDYTVEQWHARNLRLYDVLVERRLMDASVISRDAHRALMDALVNVSVGACVDPQNAGHVRAQNENIIYYGISAAADVAALSVSLAAGFIHDLNKAFGEALRGDDFAVRDEVGAVLPEMTTAAQIVGLNHLGERTRKTLEGVTRLSRGALPPEIAVAVDRCIIHHGLGSSQFIRDLVNGRNSWWGNEFVDSETGARRLVHPEQPPLSLASALHDLADSTQQMQAGVAWLLKYPAGYWRSSGRSFASMLSGDGEAEAGDIPMSLRKQIIVETETCLEIVERAAAEALVTGDGVRKLTGAVHRAARSSELWVDDSAEYLADEDGYSVYHDVARETGVSPPSAHARLLAASPGTPEGDLVEAMVWRSARRLDAERAEELALMIEFV